MSGQRIVIADDHPMVRRALAEAVKSVLTGARVDEVGSLDEARAALSRMPSPDLLLLDLNMPGMVGFTGLAAIRADHPTVPVVVVSADEDPQAIRSALAFGASGYVPKSAPLPTIGEAIQAVLGGQVWIPPGHEASEEEAGADTVETGLNELTPQQLRVLLLIAEGKLNKQIAFEMELTEATVKAHVTAIFRKLGVRSRTQAAIAARRIKAGA
ncbi:MAG: response regulator transcription factor [Alphaproteobacteria bacterium]|nr:response regulator transcription factor [Alphaproteobacteria bacterium]